MISLRSYTSAEFDFACQLKGIEGEDARAKFQPRFDASGRWEGHFYNSAIDLDGVAVGEAQARHCAQAMPPGTAEVGIELVAQVRGQGIGTEVLNLLKSDLFATGFYRISGSTDVSNIPMQRAFEKAGWKFEGISRHLMPSGEELPHDYKVYAITKWD
ncbi:MAG: GNAT family protein [Actinomycetes bacterium]